MLQVVQKQPNILISQTTELQSSICRDQHKLSPSVSLTPNWYQIILNCSGWSLAEVGITKKNKKNETKMIALLPRITSTMAVPPLEQRQRWSTIVGG